MDQSTLARQNHHRLVAQSLCRRSIVAGFLIFLLVLILGAMLVGAATYTRKASFSAVRFSHAELAEMVGKVRNLIESANANYKAPYYETYRLRVGDGEMTLTLGRTITSDALRRAPQVAYEMRFSYENGGAPISRVEIDFSDFRREALVEGTEPDQVDALIALLDQHIRKHTTVMGGVGFRFLVGGSLLLIGWSALFLPRLSASVKVDAVVRLLMTVTLMAMGFFVLGFSSEIWFPGTAVYAGDASFIVRNARTISFISLLLALLGPLASIARTLYSQGRSAGSSK